MKHKITEEINTVAWPEGISNAPADLVTKAKAMADEGKIAQFGKLEGNPNAWVVLSVNEANTLYVAARATS